MSAEKLSLSFDPGLWLARAAEATARQRALRQALDSFAAEHGPLTDADIDGLITDARAASSDAGAA